MVNPIDYAGPSAEPKRSMDAMLATKERPEQQITLVSHSTLLYWWPVWLVGYICAAITALGGVRATVDGGDSILISSGQGAGLTFITVLLLVILFTNARMRGVYSAVAILAVAFIAVLFAWLGWWDDIFAIIPDLNVHMNVGFYLIFSTVLFIMWAMAFFIFDRMKIWIVRPGQMTVKEIIGGGETSYDARGMLFEEHSDDLFRHILLGLGSGDLRITTAGAKREEFYLPNVLFADWKVKEAQRLIAVKPDTVT
ncbi:MAG: hypothetical protein NW215_09855 [Hyphomicrobiales bacterium]|nr:hypothetical protein [Hyphomicrobiales bacterium]